MFFSGSKTFRNPVNFVCSFRPSVGGAAERPGGPQWASLGRRMFGPSARRAVANWSVAFRGVLSRLDQLIDRPRDFSIHSMTSAFVSTHRCITDNNLTLNSNRTVEIKLTSKPQLADFASVCNPRCIIADLYRSPKFGWSRLSSYTLLSSPCLEIRITRHSAHSVKT